MNDKSPFQSFGGTLRADPPQRYSGNYSRYLSRGGQRHLAEDLERYLTGGAHSGDLARFYFFSLAFDQIVKEGLHGDLAELGVYKGNTAALLAAYARRLGATAYLLDTYAGFSQVDLVGIDAGAKPGSFSDTSLEEVRALVGEENVKFVKGLFPATSSLLPADGSYCLVHIDCDLYMPMASALDYFYPRLVPGGFLIAHDYSSLHWNGAEKAVDEFFQDKPECPLPLPDNAGSVVIRKARPSNPEANWLERKRRALLGPDWTEAANGKLAELLGNGWSGPEPWGVWGVGDSHILHLAPPSDPTRDLDLEFDVEAALTAARSEQIVEVSQDGKVLEIWTFSRPKNRGIRRLRLSADLAKSQRSFSTIRIEFRPQSVKGVSEINPGSSDHRSLGLGLHRVRLAQS
jgi:Macrocin-O-methyltransferase (TylF)